MNILSGRNLFALILCLWSFGLAAQEKRAMRRLEKECHFLQYRNEPHHPKKYANKLDCTLKYKEYLDHYLKGEPAADWIKTGVPYKGK